MASLKLKKRTETNRFTKEDVKAGEKELPLHYSVSQLNQSNRCRRQRYFRYGCGLKIPPNFNLYGGLSVHHAAEAALRKKQSRRSLSEADQLDIATDHFKDKFANEVHEIEETRSACIDEIVAMVKTWRKFIMPVREPIPKKITRKIANIPDPKLYPQKKLNGIPVARNPIKFTGIEQEFWIDLGLDKYIMGFIDLIDRIATLADLKTTKRKKNESELRSHQLSTYVIAAKKLGWPTPKRVALDVVVRPQARSPEGFGQLLSARAPGRDRLLHTIDAYKAMEAADKRGDFPAQYSNDCSWCGYKQICDKVGSVKYHV